MAFTLLTFSSIAGNSRRGKSPVFHSYATDDDTATVRDTPNYFAEIIQDLSVGDFIFVNSSVDGQFVLTVLNKGLNGVIDVGDSMLSAVDSVFTRTGDVVAEVGDYTANQVVNIPTAPITATDVQGAIDELALISGGRLIDDPDPTLAANLNMNGNDIVDVNDNELVTFTSTAAAVNSVDVTNAATATAPVISSNGDDANVDLSFSAKGTGQFIFDSPTVINRLNNTLSATTLYQTASSTTWLTGLDSSPVAFADDYVIKSTIGGNPAMVIDRTNNFFGFNLGGVLPVFNYQFGSDTASNVMLLRGSTLSEFNVESLAGNALQICTRGNNTSIAANLYKTQSSVNEWFAGIDGMVAGINNNFQIKRFLALNPDFTISEAGGFVGINTGATDPQARLHVKDDDARIFVDSDSGEARIDIECLTGDSNLYMTRGNTNFNSLVRFNNGVQERWVAGLSANPVLFNDDFCIKLSEGASPAFVIDRTNNHVGIGANAAPPAGYLQVRDVNNDVDIVIVTGQNGKLVIDRGSKDTDSGMIEFKRSGTTEIAIGFDDIDLARKDDFQFRSSINGTLYGYIDNTNGGLVWGASTTGGSQGAGTINAAGVYDDGVVLTCYVLEKLVDGDVDLDKWDAIGTSEFLGYDEDGKELRSKSKHEPANRFKEKLTPYMDIEEYTKFFKTNKHLPSFPSFDDYDQLSVGDLAQRLWETVEFQAVHNSQLLDKVQNMESRIQDLEKKLTKLGV